MAIVLTKYQGEVLRLFRKHFNGQWFVCSESRVATTIKRPAHTLETLHRKGALERRINPDKQGMYSDDFWQYRVPA